MDSIEWKRELNQMLNIVEEQSTQSFGLINQRFEQLDIPFDDEFQKHVMKMAKIRLESSFAKIAMKQWDARQARDVDMGGDIGTTSKTSQGSKPSAKMSIFVELPGGNTITLEVKPFETVQSVKEKIQEKEGIRLGRKHLLFGGTKLNDDGTLADQNIQKDSTLRLATGRSTAVNSKKN